MEVPKKPVGRVDTVSEAENTFQESVLRSTQGKTSTSTTSNEQWVKLVDSQQKVINNFQAVTETLNGALAAQKETMAHLSEAIEGQKQDLAACQETIAAQRQIINADQERIVSEKNAAKERFNKIIAGLSPS